MARAGKALLAARLAWSAAALTLAHYVLLDVAGRIGLLGMGATCWLVVAMLAVAAVRRASTASEGATLQPSLRAAA